MGNAQARFPVASFSAAAAVPRRMGEPNPPPSPHSPPPPSPPPEIALCIDGYWPLYATQAEAEAVSPNQDSYARRRGEAATSPCYSDPHDGFAHTGTPLQSISSATGFGDATALCTQNSACSAV